MTEIPFDKIVSSIPQSLPIILQEMRNRPLRREVLERQFEMLCKLAERASTFESKVQRDIANIARIRIMSARTEERSVPWMAADLLGDHMDITIGYDVLLDIVQHSSRARPRAIAMHGLRMLLGRPLSQSQRRIINETLRKSALNDRSSAVRAASRVAMQLAGKTSTRDRR